MIIRAATAQDCERIAEFAALSFSQTFGHLYRPENLLHHLLHKFSADYFANAIAAGDSVLMMEEGSELIGYAKVGHLTLPVKPPIPKGAEEIQRVYIAKERQGQGLGKKLMMHILGLPRITTAPAIYIGVWEENLRAQQLYTQYGFKPAGNYLYQVGDQFDREIIMLRMR